MTLLEPNEFFSLIWPQNLQTRETFELRPRNRETKGMYREFCTSIPEFLTRAADKKYNECDIYFGVSTRFGHSGKKVDCYRTQAVWSDIDGKKREECSFGSREPNILVDSGGGIHAYWLLERPFLVRGEERWEKIEAVNRWLCRQFDGDNAAIDISRILRVPSFFNNKYDPPKKVKAYLLHERRFKLSSFPEIKRESKSATDINLEGGRIRKDLPEKIKDLLGEPGGESYEGDYSRQDYATILGMLNAGLSTQDCYTTFVSSARGRHAAERKEGHFQDYLTRSIAKAASYASENKNGNGGRKISVDFGKRKDGDGRIVSDIIIHRADKVVLEDIQWLWEGYIPQGKMTVLAGDPGLGKSTISLDLVSRVSLGTAMPLGKREVSGTCIIASAEDSKKDTIIPRLVVLGANLQRIHVLDRVVIDEEERILSFPRDTQRLGELITQFGARLVVIDPFNAFLERGTDSYKDQDVRAVMHPLSEIAEATSCAILIIAHLNKKEDLDVIHRVGGSIGITGGPRSVLGVSELEESSDVRVLYRIKGNVGPRPPSLSFRTVEKHRTQKDPSEWKGIASVKASAVQWLKKVDFDPRTHSLRDTKGINQDIETFLKGVLLDSRVPIKDVYKEGRRLGFKVSDIMKVGKKLVKPISQGRDGQWYWELRSGSK